ncbi:hypothetical protein [Tsukamurella sp. NPDC003166]|uniref:hypothetical protein n=1 Tax=Tsukamurella sp. NPDC003166 TaxID=3154444 RepID=UPI0033AE6EC8
MNSLTRRALSTLIAAGAVAALTGPAVAVAAPAATGAVLTVSAPNRFNIHVRIEGVFRMSVEDAKTIIRYMNDHRAGGVTYTLRGDDPGTDDAVLFERFAGGTGTYPGGELVVVGEGLHYLREMDVPRQYLNEDDGPFDFTDEVYAQVHLAYATGGDRFATSNVAVRQF